MLLISNIPCCDGGGRASERTKNDRRAQGTPGETAGTPDPTTSRLRPRRLGGMHCLHVQSRAKLRRYFGRSSMQKCFRKAYRPAIYLFHRELSWDAPHRRASATQRTASAHNASTPNPHDCLPASIPQGLLSLLSSLQDNSSSQSSGKRGGQGL